MPFDLAPLAPGLSLNPYSSITLHGWCFPEAVFLDAVARERPPATRSDRFPSADGGDVGALEGLGDVLLTHAEEAGARKVLLRAGESLVLVSVDDGFVDAIAAGTAESAAAALRQVKARMEAMLPAGGNVPVIFWWKASIGPRRRRRLIDVPAWEDVAHNYSEPVKAALGRLMAATGPPVHGRLLLWHGPPGTGKSFALRALLDAWRDWCAPHFITDPDQLFGGSAAYLAQLLATEGAAYERPWRLVIVEDAGELMSADARSRSGQGLSRLLNLTDGLLGQGTRTLLLITTNEPLGRLDPAVHRPGRCWAEVEFAPLRVAEANAWLEARGAGRRVTTATPLAELFAPDSMRREDRVAFGFGAGG